VTLASGDDVTCTMTNTLVATPGISLDKTASTADFSNPPVPGDKITYTFVITNTGNVTLSGVDLDDTLLGYSNVTCGATTLAPGASTNCTADYTLTQANIDAGTVSNTATACGDPPAGAGNEVCSSDGTTTTITATRTLSLVKTAKILTITYSFVITNTGNATLSTIGLSDSKLGTVTGCTTASLAPGATAECSANYTVTQADLTAGFVTNTATATAAGGVTTQTSVTVTPLTVVSPPSTP
jgi:large repetitive protein